MIQQTIEEIKKLKKDELAELVISLQEQLAKVNKELAALKAKSGSKVGYKAGAGRKNPLVD